MSRQKDTAKNLIMEDRNNCADRIDIKTIVIDPGTETCKAGFSGEKAPRAILETAIGKPKAEHVSKLSGKEFYAGDDMKEKRALLTIRYPMGHGVVTNWDVMEKLYQHIFERELGVDPEEHPLLISEPPLTQNNRKTNREKLSETMFETFEIPALYIACQGVLVLQDSGRQTGVVLDSGREITNAIPVYEGHSLPYAVEGMEYGGRDVTTTFSDQIYRRGVHKFGIPNQRRKTEHLKEKTCYVALNYEEELDKNERLEYVLGNGEIIVLGNERFSAPEVLFRMGQQNYSRNVNIHELVYNSIMKCSPDIQKDMWAHIVLAGGNTMFPGFAERLRKELRVIAPPDMEINVIEHPDRIYSGWRGGSLMASESDFVSRCVKIDDYDEYGPTIFDRK